MKSILSVLMLVMLVFLSSCSTRSPTPNYYLLENPLGDKVRSGDLRIGLGPVEIADYLQRPQIALRSHNSQIRFADFERWASSLRGLIINAIQFDLSNQLNTDNIFEYPWRKLDQVDYSISLNINRLDASFETGEAHLEAKGIIKNSDGESFVETFSLMEPIEGGSYDGLVSAERRLLLLLSEQISLSIERLQSGQRP